MHQSDPQREDSSRWWEFYAVRYALGTVIGGVIFFFLCSTNPVLQQLIFGANVHTLNAPILILLGAYGLAFCYFASAPVLVLHTTRFFFVYSLRDQELACTSSGNAHCSTGTHGNLLLRYKSIW